MCLPRLPASRPPLPGGPWAGCLPPGPITASGEVQTPVCGAASPGWGLCSAPWRLCCGTEDNRQNPTISGRKRPIETKRARDHRPQLSQPRTSAASARPCSQSVRGSDGLFSLPETRRWRPGLRPVQAFAFCGPRSLEAPELRAAAAEGGRSGRYRRRGLCRLQGTRHFSRARWVPWPNGLTDA